MLVFLLLLIDHDVLDVLHNVVDLSLDLGEFNFGLLFDFLHVLFFLRHQVYLEQTVALQVVNVGHQLGSVEVDVEVIVLVWVVQPDVDVLVLVNFEGSRGDLSFA